MYGTEMWAVKKAQEKKLDSAEMRMFRWMSRVTKLDRIRNERIRGTTKVGEIFKKVDCSSRRTLVYSRIISKTLDPDLLIFVVIHGWLFAFRCVRYAFVMYITCMYRQNIYQATYVLYSCYMCVISYMCGTMAYSI